MAHGLVLKNFPRIASPFSLALRLWVPLALAGGLAAQEHLVLRDRALGLSSEPGGNLPATLGNRIEFELLGEPGSGWQLELSSMPLPLWALGTPPSLVLQRGAALDAEGRSRWSARLPEGLPLGRDYWIQATLQSSGSRELRRSNAVRLCTQAWKVQDLPLLPAGQFIGLGYGAAASEVGADLDSLWNRCHAAGLGAMTVSMAWSDIETKPGVYDTAYLELLLQLVQLAGLRPYLVITTIDTLALSIPSDLLDPGDRRKLSPGLGWDSHELSRRLAAVLDRSVPILMTYGGFYLSLGNEVDGLLFDSASKTGAYATFLQAARQHAQSIAPKLAVGTSVSWEGLRTHPARFQQLQAACDNIALTYYPLGADYAVQDPARVGADLQAMLGAVAPRPLLLQEFGYPSGHQTSAANGSSEEQQRRFIENCFKTFRDNPRIRYASYANLGDWGPADLGLMQLHYNSSEILFVEFLGSLGLSGHRSAKPKAGYEEFLRGLKSLSR